MATSDEDVAKKAEAVEKLRQQVANAESTREVRERELHNDIQMRQLEAEEARLKTRLAVAKEEGKVAHVKAGAEAPLSAIEVEMQKAVAAQEANAASTEAEKKEN